MSTEQSLDPQLVEETKQQIRSLVAEIAELTKRDVSAEEFYAQFLTRVVQALAAIGGAVWVIDDQRRLALQYQVNLQHTRLRESEEAQAQHARLLHRALTTEEGMLVQPHSGAGEADDEAANPTDFLIVLGQLKTDLEVAGVLEVFQRPEPGPNTQKGYLRFVLQMCELAGDFLKSRQLRHFSDRQILWTQLEEFTHVVHASLDPRQTAYTIANEGRRLVECDRVSVALRKGNKCTIEAISGQDLFDRRSNTVRLLGRLATAVTASGDPIWYAGDTRDMPPQVEDAVQDYVDESHSKNVAVLPLKRPDPPEEDDPHKPRRPEPPVGALIVEQIEDSRVPQSMVQRVEVVCRHSSTALANAMEHQNLFLMPVWRALGKTRWVLAARTLPKTLTIAGAVLALLLVLIFWPASFEVDTKGKAQPVNRRDVFVRVGGDVSQLNVEHGDWVRQGDPLLTLRSDEVEKARIQVLGDLRAVEQDRHSKLQQLIEGGLTEDKEKEIKAQLSVLEKKRETLVMLLEKQRAIASQLVIRSPIRGRIITWDPERLLDKDKPLQRSQRLMEVADLEGPWQVELDMPEDRMGFIVAAEKELLADLHRRLREALRRRLEQSGAPAAGQPAGQGDAASDGSPEQPPETGEDSTADDSTADDLLEARIEQQVAKLRDRDWRVELRNVRRALRKELAEQLRGELRRLLAEMPEQLPVEVAEEAQAEPAEGREGGSPAEADDPATAPAKGADDGDAGAAADAGKTPRLEEEKADEKTPRELYREARRIVEAAVETPAGATSYAGIREKLRRAVRLMPDPQYRQKLRAILGEELRDRLRVSFQLATHPGTTYYGWLEKEQLSAEVQGEKGNTVRLKVSVNKQELPEALRPGAEVTAKVACGRRPLGYVIFHDVIAFVQNVWFRWF